MLIRKSRRFEFVVAFLFGVLVCSCEDYDKEPQPLDVLRFPTDMLIGGLEGESLFVVSTNFDRGYGGGVVHILELDKLNEMADGVVFGAIPPKIEQIPLTGAANIGSFGGKVSSVYLADGSQRLFVPLRGESALNIVDVGTDGQVSCFPDGGNDCRLQPLELLTPGGLPLADPFASAVVGRYLYVAAARLQMVDDSGTDSSTRGSYMARVSVDNPMEILSRYVGSSVFRDLVPSPDGASLFSIGARYASATQTDGGGEIRSFSVDRFEAESLGDQFKSLAPIVGSNDGRSMVFSRDGRKAYALTRNPSALIVFDVDGGAGSMTTRSLLRIPDSPSRLALFESEDAELAFVTSTRADSLSIVDLHREQIVSVLDGTICEDLDSPCPSASRVVNERDPRTDVGVQPWGVVVHSRHGGGVRAWVGSFADGTLRAVDIPDLSRPWQARVVAIVGGMEEML